MSNSENLAQQRRQRPYNSLMAIDLVELVRRADAADFSEEGE